MTVDPVPRPTSPVRRVWQSTYGGFVRSFKSLWFWFLEVTVIAAASGWVGSAHPGDRAWWVGILVAAGCFGIIAALVGAAHLLGAAVRLARYTYVRDAVYYLLTEAQVLAPNYPTGNRFSDVCGMIEGEALRGNLKAIGRHPSSTCHRSIAPGVWETSEIDWDELLDKIGGLGRTRRRYGAVQFSGYRDVMVNRRQLQQAWPPSPRARNPDPAWE